MNARLFQKMIVLTAMLAAVLACSFDLGGGATSSNLESTQTSIVLQQTELALRATDFSATQTASALVQVQQVPPTPTPDFAATAYAMSSGATMTAMSIPAPIMMQTPIPPQGGQAQPTQPPPLPPTQPPAQLNNTAGFEDWMKTANIVVFEDIVVDQRFSQYVKDTLKSMGLRFKWDGNAMGWFKNDLLAGADGKAWDLVIIAAEARDQVSGEYFDYLNNVLNNNTAVIMESWYLENISEGKVAPILAQCGLQVYPYVPKWGTVNDVVIYPLPPANHPLLTQPNSALAFTKALDTWIWSNDLGTKMALTGTGDAQMLLGTNAQETMRDGTLAVCMDGQLILQTFSSHSFPYRVVGPLWENYIYNALLWRFNHK